MGQSRVQNKWLALKMTKIYGPLVQNLEPFPNIMAGDPPCGFSASGTGSSGATGLLRGQENGQESVVLAGEVTHLRIWAVSETELWRTESTAALGGRSLQLPFTRNSVPGFSRRPQGIINKPHPPVGAFFHAFPIYLGLSETCLKLGNPQNVDSLVNIFLKSWDIVVAQVPHFWAGRVGSNSTL